MVCSDLVVLFSALVVVTVAYDANWQSIDARPLPAWYDEAKIGIFIHWGVFSVPSFGTNNGGASGEWFWNQWLTQKNPAYEAFVNQTENPSFTYPDYAARFNAEFFNATQWAELFKASGAKYVVPTSKHHEGFTNWPSATSFNWNSVDVGPHRDLIGELSTATKDMGLTFGVYHSLFEWYNPIYLADKASNWNTTTFVEKTMGEIKDLVLRYEPELIWSDGDWEAPDSYWNAPANILQWLVNDSPVKDTVVFNDRWGIGDTCVHGQYWTCDDRYLPNQLQHRKWENAFTLDRYSWGYRRNGDVSDYLTVYDVVTTVIQTIAFGGNALINVGPAADGTISPIFEDRLLGLGAWLAVNGDAIYATVPWRVQNETASNVWYTSKSGNTVYAIFTSWPADGVVTLVSPVPSASTEVGMIGFGGSVMWTKGNSGVGMVVTLPSFNPSTAPCDHAWTLQLTGVS